MAVSINHFVGHVGRAAVPDPVIKIWSVPDIKGNLSKKFNAKDFQFLPANFDLFLLQKWILTLCLSIFNFH